MLCTIATVVCGHVNGDSGIESGGRLTTQNERASVASGEQLAVIYDIKSCWTVCMPLPPIG